MVNCLLAGGRVVARRTVRRQPGCESVVVGVDWTSGHTLIVSMWDTEEHARFSRDALGGDVLSKVQAIGGRPDPPLDLLAQAFKYGGGVPQSAYPSAMWDGLERFTGTWFRNSLVQEWLPAVPEVQEKLLRGALVADIGCGRGQALLALARAFPESRFAGFDSFEPTIGAARANAQSASVADRVTFECLDVLQGLPDRYDLITAFDVLHDMADPSAALNAIRRALRPDGTFLCLEMNTSDDPDENVGPVAAIQYSVSVLYCMTTSLAAGGVGLGAAGLPEARIREFAQRSGFGSVRRLPVQNPFNTLYELKP